MWQLGHIAFLVAHLPMSAVYKHIDLAMVSAETTKASNMSTINTTTISTSPNIMARIFEDPLWKSWRSSSLYAACIPRIKLLVDSWARLLELSKDGTTKVIYTDLDLSFLGMCSWDVLLIGIVLLAGSLRDDSAGGQYVCVCEGNAGSSSLCCCAENAAFTSSWRRHLSVIKRSLVVMGRKWKCANIFFQMLSLFEMQRETDELLLV